jgi:hypothetical protein
VTTTPPSGPEYEAMLLALKPEDRVRLDGGRTGFVVRVDEGRIQIDDLLILQWFRRTASRKTPAGHGIGDASGCWIVGVPHD